MEKQYREAVATKDYLPLRDSVVLVGTRKKKGLVLLPDAEEETKASNSEVYYESMIVVGYGKKTEDVSIGDKVHLPESRVLAPTFLWTEEDEEKDYFSIPEAYIKGLFLESKELKE